MSLGLNLPFFFLFVSFVLCVHLPFVFSFSFFFFLLIEHFCYEFILFTCWLLAVSLYTSLPFLLLLLLLQGFITHILYQSTFKQYFAASHTESKLQTSILPLLISHICIIIFIHFCVYVCQPKPHNTSYYFYLMNYVLNWFKIQTVFDIYYHFFLSVISQRGSADDEFFQFLFHIYVLQIFSLGLEIQIGRVFPPYFKNVVLLSTVLHCF